MFARPRTLVARVSFVLALAASRLALAQERPAGSVDVRLRYDAPPVCPSASTFVEELERRSKRIVVRIVSEKDDAAIVVLSDGDSFRGTLRTPGVEPRDVRGQTCDEVLAALSFVLALSYDPDATPPPPPPQPPIPEDSASVKLQVPRPPKTRATEAPIAPPRSSPTSRPAPSSGGMSWGAGLRAELSTLAGPTFALRPFVTVADRSARVWSPAFRVSFGRSWPGFVHSSSAKATPGTLRFSDLELEGCMLHVGAGPFSVRMCVWLSGGIVDSEGRGPIPQVSSSLWAGGGLAAPFAWTLSRMLSVEAYATLGRTLLFDRYYFFPDTTAYEAPLVYARLGGGVTLFLP